MPELPDLDELARAAAQAGIPNSPSELHGVVCGLLATGHGHEDNALLGTLAAHAVQFAGRIGDAGLGGGAGEFVEVGQFGHGAPSLLFNDFLQSGAKCLTRLDLR